MSDGVSLPQLLTAREAAQKLQGLVSAERLLELAEAGYLPHWRSFGHGDESSEPLFHMPTLRRYVVENILVENKGRAFPKVLPVYIPTTIDREDRSRIPKCLHSIVKHLERLDVNGFPPAIYFLCHGDEVVYVGQSTNMVGRIITHQADKVFDRVYFLRTPESDLEHVEAAFIVLLQPKYNGKPSKLRKLTAEHLAVAGLI